MDLKQLVMLTFQVSILATVFGFGLKAGPDALMYLVRRPGLLLRSLPAVLVIMPIFAVVLATTFNIRPASEIALIALAISPLPPLLPKKESKAGGQHAFGLAFMVMLALLAIVTVPLSAEILERVFGRPLGAAPAAIARAWSW
jgi:BASS family bile acid:Na+ symporter